jgi:hypothetical protein
VKKGLFNNNGDFSALLLTQKHNNLRVISTPEFPVPYYQRITRAPPSPEQVTIDLQTILEPVNDTTVIRVKQELAKTSDGMKVLDFVDNHMKGNNFETHITTIAPQCNIYAEELIHYLDSAHEENCRILKTCDLADCLKF